MSRISAPADRPIPTNEPTLATQQTSETESVQKTDLQGKAILNAEQFVDQHTPSTDTKGAQNELLLSGVARQAEMLAQFPIPSSPTLKDLPDMHPNLDPNIHLDEKIDVTKNLPDGLEINKGLDGLDWGPSKAKTGPGHFGVEMTYGGMKAPTDRIAEVLNSGKPGQSNTSLSERDARMVEKTGGDGGAIRSPKYDLISQAAEPKGFLEKVVDFLFGVGVGKAPIPGAPELVGGPELVEEVTGRSADLLDGVEGAATGGNQVKGANKTEDHDKVKYVDGDAGGGVYEPSAEDISRIAKVHFGSIEHGINPDLGVNGGHIEPKAEDLKDPRDLVRDPIGDGDASAVEDSPARGKLAMEIHGPRTLNPDSGFETPPTAGDIRGGGPDPNTGNPS